MKKRPDEQDLVKTCNITTAAECSKGNKITTKNVSAATSRAKHKAFWNLVSAITKKKSDTSRAPQRVRPKEKRIFETEFVAESQPAVAVGKDMCSTSIQEAFQLITASARCVEQPSQHGDDDWVIVHYKETESTLLLKPARYIQRCILPTFHRRDVRPIIQQKASDPLPTRIDNQYLLDLKRTSKDVLSPDTTKQWSVNGQPLPRDPVQNLVEIKKHAKDRSFQVGQRGGMFAQQLIM